MYLSTELRLRSPKQSKALHHSVQYMPVPNIVSLSPPILSHSSGGKWVPQSCVSAMGAHSRRTLAKPQTANNPGSVLQSRCPTQPAHRSPLAQARLHFTVAAFGEDAASHAAGTADRQNGVPFWNAHVWRRCLWRGEKSGEDEEGYGLDLASLLVVGVKKMAPDGGGQKHP
jgi:hypothetical protein